MKTNTSSAPPSLLPLAPKLMLLFWMLLGAVAGVKLMQGVWRMAGWNIGAIAIAAPIGAAAGAIAGGLIGRITRPSLLVLIMALLAGWSLGALAGGLAWAETGQFAGGLLGALVGGLTWTLWLLRERKARTNDDLTDHDPRWTRSKYRPDYQALHSSRIRDGLRGGELMKPTTKNESDGRAISRAQRIAQAALDFEQQTTGRAPKSVTVVLSDDTLVITLHGALSPAEKVLAGTPEGIAQVQEFHQQLFASASASLRQEIKRITGVEVREAAAEVETATGTVVKVFASGSVVQVFLLARGVPTDSWSGNSPVNQ